MVYEYYYTQDGRLERTQKEPDYYILGMTRDDIAGLLGGWKLVEFTSEQVVMRRDIANHGYQNYTLGIKDGFVAVFYDEGAELTGLKEITDTPVNALTSEERERLTIGIPVNGYERLVRLLEDYSS
jgi:hypothetical protein